MDTRYTIYGLSPDTEYEIKVLSANNVGEGMYSEAVTGRTLGMFGFIFTSCKLTILELSDPIASLFISSSVFPPGFQLTTFPTLSPIQQDQSSQISSNETVNELNTTDDQPSR